MRRTLGLVLLVGCSTASVSRDEQPIIGGTPSVGEQPTVLLASFPPDRSVLSTCTGVLVSPTVVLTAAHCVDPLTHPNYLFGVFVGDDATPYDTLAKLEPRLVAVAEVHAHPQYAQLVADVGVAILAQPSPIAPAVMNRTPLDGSVVGKPARIVGFGQIVYQQANQRRYEALTTVAALESQTIVIGDASKHSCLGDSGGGVFVDGVLVGIDSYGPVGCTGAAHYQRTDFFAPFFDAYAPPPMPMADAGVSGPEAGADPTMGDGGGCATTSATGGLTGLPLLALVGVLARRRRAS